MTARVILRRWPLRVIRARASSAWPLLIVVQLVAVLAGTTIASVTLIESATENGGVRTALAALPLSQTQTTIRMTLPKVTVARARAAGERAVATVAGAGSGTAGSGFAVSGLDSVPGIGTLPALTYFGELDGIRSHATLATGRWAPLAGSTTGDIPVTLPIAAESLGLDVGSTFPVQVGVGTRTALVTGLYRATGRGGAYWADDILTGQGNRSGFPKPGVDAFVPTDAFGPLIVPTGGMDAAGIPVQSVQVTYSPDYAKIAPDHLAPLIDRLSIADSTVPTAMGDVANEVDYTSDAMTPITQIASSLVATRSVVAVMILLLLVLAVATLAQAARLLVESRTVERQLMEARGAARGQIIAIAALEALVMVVITTLCAPPLAAGVYAIFARQGAMVAAHMPAIISIPLSTWTIALGTAVLFGLVLVSPLFGARSTFVDEEKARVRQRRGTGLMRSGLDLGVVVIAAVLLWRLISYHPAVETSATLSVDPLLAAGPAVVLLACALLCARLFPLGTRLTERAGSRSSGIVAALAFWEVGRRSRRATSAVLALTIALAIGTFSQTFLLTWQQSQVDQAALAVGPPVRVGASASVGEQSARLAAGATELPQAAIRRSATVAGPNATLSDPNSTDGPTSVVLGLTAKARSMIDRGTLATEGGAQVAADVRTPSIRETRVRLPVDTTGISARMRVGTPASAIPGASLGVRAILEDANGLLSTVDLGNLPIDGRPHSVSGLLAGRSSATPLSFVGLQTYALVSNPALYTPLVGAKSAEIDLTRLAALSPSGDGTSSHRVSVSANSRWFGENADSGGGAVTSVAHVPAGWQLGLRVVVPGDLTTQSASFALVGWRPIANIPAVMSSALATDVLAKPGASLTLAFPGALVTIRVAASTPLVPGSADASLLTARTASGANSAAAEVTVVDQSALEHALAQEGTPGAMADEWWIDVKPGTERAYLAAHASSGAASGSVLAAQMQDDPLRVAIPITLWLAIVAALALAAVGFAVHSTSSLRSRRVEFAELRAVGLSRRALTRAIGLESLVLCTFGAVLGIAVGLAVSALVDPLVAVSPDGSPPVPAVHLAVPWWGILLLVVETAVVLVIVVVVSARSQRGSEPSAVLREVNE